LKRSVEPARIAVAYSGGRDSTALLHATLKAAAGQGIEVLALHVHHGLNPAADAWVAHCKAQCERWARQGWPVHFVCTRLTARPGPGDSIESWARQHRYEALKNMMQAHGVSMILLAHHRRDQAETFLLQALRGAGVAGLSCMPAVARRHGVEWLRPWLDHARESIEAYVRKHRLKHIDDDSNGDARYARNRLRLQVWPALSQAFPQAEASLSDAASWAQEAQACLVELAELDLAATAGPDGLRVLEWQRLSPARRGNALRAWLLQSTGCIPPASLVRRLHVELPRPGSAAWPVAGGVLQRHRQRLRFVPTSSTNDMAPALPEAALCIKRAGRYALPGWKGCLQVARVKQDGVPLAWLAHVELRARQGGEQFQAGIGRPPRSLKKQFQAAGIAQWQREGPLLFSGGQLVFVPGLGLDARVIGLPGQPQVVLQWLPSGGRPI
jgi:tRNA(Ile)-lysidine synthase